MENETNNESEEARELRKSIEDMEQELKGLDNDIEEAKKIPDPEVREVALRNFRQMRKSTSEMIASFRETYRVMLESDALQANRVEKEGK